MAMRTTDDSGSSPEPSAGQNELKNVSDIVGDWGPWQRTIFAFFFVGAMSSAWHSLGLSFYAPKIDFWCKDRPSDFQNLTDAEWMSRSIEEPDLRCNPYANSSTECHEWDYDLSFYSATIINEWDLVCDRSWLASMSQSMYMAGVMVTVIVMGQAADKYGRFPVIWAGLIIELLAGISCAFSMSIEHYMISRFFLAFGASARWSSGFVLILETCGPRYRSDLGMGIEFGWALGYVLLPGAAYLLRHFRYLQLVAVMPQVILLFCWFKIPESPRWQLTHRRIDQAKKAIRKAVKINGYAPDNLDVKLKKLTDRFEAEQNSNNGKKESTLIDLMRTPNVRKKTLILYFSWFVNAFVYYGLSLNTNDLGGNPFFNFLLAGAVEFPAYGLSIYALRRFGRRWPLAGAMFGAGLGCLATVIFSTSEDYVELRVAFAMLGKFCVTSSYGMIYVYSAELFPTVVRNVGVGSSSMVARIGSILAPFVKELGEYTHRAVPLGIFGVLSVADGLLLLLLPETKGEEIPDTMEQAENFGRKEEDDTESRIDLKEGRMRMDATN